MAACLTPQQCRAARRLLDWSSEDLSDVTGVPVAVIAEFEEGRRVLPAATAATLRCAMEAAGAGFVRDPFGREAVEVAGIRAA